MYYEIYNDFKVFYLLYFPSCWLSHRRLNFRFFFVTFSVALGLFLTAFAKDFLELNSLENTGLSLGSVKISNNVSSIVCLSSTLNIWIIE